MQHGAVPFWLPCPVCCALPVQRNGKHTLFFFEGDTHEKEVISAALAGTLAVSLLSACGASNEPQNISDVSSAASSEATSTTASSESTGDAAQELTFVLNNIPDGWIRA